MRFDVLTTFPGMFAGALGESIIGRAVKNGIIELNIVNIRDFSSDRHRKTDDYPYGGGCGLVMTPQPIYDAWLSVSGRTDAAARDAAPSLAPSLSPDVASNPSPGAASGVVSGVAPGTAPDVASGDAPDAEPNPSSGAEPGGAPSLAPSLSPAAAPRPSPGLAPARTIYLSPQGATLTQKKALELASEDRLILLCGHYEGVDERAIELVADEEISIGDYVLTGGELPAMALIDCVSRLVPGVLPSEEAYTGESHFGGLLEFPQYTRPYSFMGKTVPDVLLSGHHRNIEEWRRRQSLERTRAKRPDLLLRPAPEPPPSAQVFSAPSPKPPATELSAPESAPEPPAHEVCGISETRGISAISETRKISETKGQIQKGGKKSMNSGKTYKFETMQVHVGQEAPDPVTDARAVPIYQTTSYVFKDAAQAAGRFGLSEGGNIYTRLMNPTSDVFEKRIAALEGGAAALATASGAAACAYSVQNIAKAGDHIVSDNAIYGGTYNLFAHTFEDIGIATTFVDGGEASNFEKAILPNTKAIFIETLGNPNSTIVDIAAVAEIAHKHGIPLIADNTFATPYLLRPIEYGADVVVHSATKFIGGHGTSIGGVIIDSGKFDWAGSGKFPGLSKPNPSYHGAVFTDAAGSLAYIMKARTTLMRDTGAVLSPFHSFIFLQGLETLSLRVERHVRNAEAVVDYLEAHPKVAKVNHPKLPGHRDHALYKKYFPSGAGSIFTFELTGGAQEARAFIDRLELFSLLANVADVKSLVIHPASTTHSQMTESELLASGIKPGTIRLSIGTEHIDDIIADLDQALALAGA